MGTVPEEAGIFNWPFEAQMQNSKDYVNQGGEHVLRNVTDILKLIHQPGLSRGAIFKAVNASLKRLGTDYIDLLQIHRYDPTVSPEETMKALHDLVESGKVNYIGASSMWTYQFARLQFVAEKNGWTKFVSMQNRYNLCYREEEREMNRFCKETGVGIIPWGPLYSGLLAKPWGVETERSKSMYLFHYSPIFTSGISVLARKQTLTYSVSVAMSGGITEADEVIIKRVQEVAEKKGCKMGQVATAWLKAKGCIPIVGMNDTSIERMDEACAVRDVNLTDDEVAFLEEPYVPKPVVGHF